jgi:hypothetical protein
MPANRSQTFISFPTSEEAREHRKTTGCGGFIFAGAEPDTTSVIFPFGMTPTQILMHSLTAGRDGSLLC